MSLMLIGGVDGTGLHLNRDQLIICEYMKRERPVLIIKTEDFTSAVMGSVATLHEAIIEFTVEPKTFELTIDEPVQSKPIAEMPQLIFRSGRIVQQWDDYHGELIHWQAPVAHKPRKLFNTIFIRRFQGNNRGRHWNRRKD